MYQVQICRVPDRIVCATFAATSLASCLARPVPASLVPRIARHCTRFVQQPMRIDFLGMYTYESSFSNRLGLQVQSFSSYILERLERLERLHHPPLGVQGVQEVDVGGSEPLAARCKTLVCEIPRWRRWGGM